MTILLKTVTGSHLYGLSHTGSDLDYYVVVDKGRTRQTIVNGVDTMRINFSDFRRYCDNGVPQSLEAMFSPIPEIDMIQEFRENYYVQTDAMVHKYRRTMLNFGDGTLKRRRHALRLGLNLQEALTWGRFSPRLSSSQADTITLLADNPYYYTILEGLL